MAAALTLKRLRSSRTLHLFDTYEGMPPPTSNDVNFRGATAQSLLETSDRSAWVWATAQLSDVKRNIESTGYNGEVKFIEGKVEHTIPVNAPDRISLLRLDTDWYESTKHELIHLFPRLSKGGVLLIDDYGHWQGARKAVDEYLQEENLPLLLHRIDYSGRIAVKV
jgi:hypothetical protein